ncbi:MAG: glycoside hydrolase family protein [Chloroflexota bacterium]|nr:glycoside hydrolase family protein [Chloroflexota bacterium]
MTFVRRLSAAVLLGAVGLGLVILAAPRVFRSAARLEVAPTAMVTVDLGAASGARLDTRLSTNLTTPGALERSGIGAAARLAAWAPPLVRLHAGADTGEPPALPAGLQRGDWNFGPLDAMVTAVRGYGGEPVINVRYPPAWMYTCPQPFSEGVAGEGALRDPSFGEFAEYVARLVGWYNTGGFTDEQGKYHQSGHQGWVRVWELWNEPDASSENPCRAAAGGAALTPAQYVTLWNTVVPRMRAVDPNIQVIGPATSEPRPEYVQALIAGAVHPPDALSFHGYGGSENQNTDKELFDGLDQLVASVDGRGRPVWITELNVNSAYDDDPGGRPWGTFGVAWGASAFRGLALRGVAVMHQFEFIASPQFGLISEQGAPRLPYWRDFLLSRAFRAGSTVLTGSTSQPGIEVLAARRPDGGTSVLLVNRQVAGASDRGGRGVATTVTVRLTGPVPAGVQLRLLDTTANAASEPPARPAGMGPELEVAFAGYGMALLDVPAEAASTPPTPVPPPTTGPPPAIAPPLGHDERYFSETGFRVDDDAIWSYFQARGRVNAFGYPVSRTVVLLGCRAQIFQRQIAQVCSGQAPGLMNLLDGDIMPYTHINGTTFPGVDQALKASTPHLSDPDYATAILDFVRSNAPDSFDGAQVNFGQTFFGMLSPDAAGTADPGLLGLLNLELLGTPISPPARDSANPNFIYQRFQRGILHFDAATGTTSGVLLADYLKAILVGEVPPDLEAQARTSRFYHQYCPGATGWLCRPDDLPATDLTFGLDKG